MTLGLPVLWRRYLSELRIERAVADRTRNAYETGWNSFVATARAMGWRLKVAEDIGQEPVPIGSAMARWCGQCGGRSTRARRMEPFGAARF